MNEQAKRTLVIVCSNCGMEITRESTNCPFCNQVLTDASTCVQRDLTGECSYAQSVADAHPLDWVRFAAAGAIGLLFALGLGYAWYAVAMATEREFVLAAILIGLVIGLVVAIAGEGRPALPYRLLGALLAAFGVFAGQYLIYGSMASSAYFEANSLLIVIYALALFEGWQGPRIAAHYGLSRFRPAKEGNQGIVLTGSLVIVACLLVAGYAGGLLAGPGTIKAKIHANRAVTLMEQGAFSQAVTELEAAVAEYDEFADAYLLLGLIKVNQYFDLDAASEDLHRALELGLDGNRYTEAHYQLSLIEWVTGELPEALEHINQAIDHDAEHPDAYLIRASILIDSGQYQNAARDVDRALKLELRAEDKAWASQLRHELGVDTKKA